MNEQHDVIVHEGAVDLDHDVVHGLAPDELIMRMEDGEEMLRPTMAAARCLLSVLMAISWQTISVGQVRDRLAVLVSLRAPDLIMGEHLWKGKVQWGAVREQMAMCPRVEWHEESGRILVALLIDGGWSEREVGMRALCMLYAFQPNQNSRPVIARSFACIGRAVGLTDRNPRSGVCAAMKRTVGELMLRMERLTRARGTGEFWFNKRRGCKEALSRAMMGKRNRAGKGKKG
ncbi:hypothetical protein [Prosthecobacter sp.]|uniref:hypothetical protein n=1 Tax=Prosthecobacter sp. TaxID=1965333 RepID=UPI00378469DC